MMIRKMRLLLTSSFAPGVSMQCKTSKQLGSGIEGCWRGGPCRDKLCVAVNDEKTSALDELAQSRRDHLMPECQHLAWQ